MTTNQSHLPVPDLDWYRDVVDGAPETIIIADQNGTILFHNSQTEGEDPAKFIGKPIFDFFLPEFYPAVRAKLERVFQTGEADTYELATTYRDTDIRWYMTRLGPITRSGQVVAVSLFIRDISQLKRSEQVLSQVNEALEKRVEERTQALHQYAHRLEASERLNAALRQAENRQMVLETLAGHCKRILEADLVGVYQVEDNRLHFSYSQGHSALPPAVLAVETDRFLYRLLKSDKICYVQLSHDGETGCQFCSYVRSQQMETLLAAPLRTGDIVVGVLYLGFRSTRQHNPGDEQLLNGFVEAGSNTLHRILVTEQLEQNIQQREHELHVLYQIMSIASEELDTETLLKKSLRATLQAINCQMGIIHLADTVDQRLKVSVSENFPEELYTFLQLSGRANDLWIRAYQQGKTVPVERLPTQSYHETAGPGVTVLTYLGIPVRTKEAPIGVMSLFSQDERLLEPGVRQLVSTIADQIGLALESTHQRQREKEALILEERQRLARELHDSVSQSLYGLVLSADVSNKLLKLKAYARLAENLSDIGEVALQSLKEMRLMLFELRPLSLETVGLIGALELRLNTVERRAGMETSFEVTGKELLPRPLDLEIYRIATEALNNSLKHSHASTVRVSLSADAGQVELVIADNGQGIDFDRKPAGGIGLSSMKERSHRIGGSLTIDSSAAAGTRVSLVVPLRKDSSVPEEAA